MGTTKIQIRTPRSMARTDAGHVNAHRRSLAFRPAEDVAADRALGYVEHLGPEYAPSVMLVNSMTAVFIMIRLQDRLF
jgi:hypothetical protein